MPATSDAPCGDIAPPDAELLVRCRAGHSPAWREVVDRYRRLVFSIARNAGLDIEDAADVTHSTFTALLDATTGWSPDDRLAPWLVTTAHRTAWQTRMRREQETATGGALPAVADDHDWAQVAALHEGLARLATPCRDLLAARYLDPAEASAAEIEDSTDRRCARCLEHLRALTGEPR